MLPKHYSHLNVIQKGVFGEAFAKMAFTLVAFEVYSSEYDDRGIDFVVRSPKGSFYSLQVKECNCPSGASFGGLGNPGKTKTGEKTLV